MDNTSESSFIYINDVQRFIESLEPTVTRLNSHNKVPINISVTHIEQKYDAQIVELHQCLFNDPPTEIFMRLCGDSHIINYCRKNSTVLLFEERVIGVTLVLQKQQSRLAYVFAVIVDRTYRRKWANVYLKYHSLKRLSAHGIDEVAYQILNENRDAFKHVKATSAKFTADNYSWS